MRCLKAVGRHNPKPVGLCHCFIAVRLNCCRTSACAGRKQTLHYVDLLPYTSSPAYIKSWGKSAPWALASLRVAVQQPAHRELGLIAVIYMITPCLASVPPVKMLWASMPEIHSSQVPHHRKACPQQARRFTMVVLEFQRQAAHLSATTTGTSLRLLCSRTKT